MAYNKLRKILISGATERDAQKSSIENFSRAERALAKKGDAPVNLARLRADAPQNWKAKDFLLHALDLLLECDAVFFLKNWKQSRAARTHYLVAREFGIKIIFET